MWAPRTDLGHANEGWEREVDDLRVDVEDLVEERKGERICERREIRKRGRRG